jgi:hypothetical protein
MEFDGQPAQGAEPRRHRRPGHGAPAGGAARARAWSRRITTGGTPLHLSNDIRDRGKGDIEYGRNVAEYVSKAVKKYKLVEVVPIQRSKAKPVVKDLFASDSQEHLPCLQGAIMFAEAGPAAIQARSDAWAARRVPDVLASPAEAVYGRCWPSGIFAERDAELLPQMKRLLAEPQVTVAVLGLRTLAERDGILDGLGRGGLRYPGPGLEVI